MKRFCSIPAFTISPSISENRYMASGFLIDGQAFYFVKGDPAVSLKNVRELPDIHWRAEAG